MTLYLFCLATKEIFLLLVYGLRKLVQRGEIEMPSEKTLSAKKERVAQLVEMLKNSAAGVLVDYKGITVEEDTKLRKELREAGVSYFVEKNTILGFALKEAGLDGITSTRRRDHLHYTRQQRRRRRIHRQRRHRHKSCFQN